MKVGLIRCMQTEDMCPATTCFKVMNTKKLAFENIEEDIEVVGLTTCGGCPGKKAVTRVNKGMKITIQFHSGIVMTESVDYYED